MSSERAVPSADVPRIPEISETEFRCIADRVYRKTGIYLSDRKHYLLQNRVQKILREYGLAGYRELCTLLEQDLSGKVFRQLVDAVSTNHTFFFREEEHFRLLGDTILPELCFRLKQQGEQEIRIWSAGCSSGEEPYSIAMTVADYLSRENRGIRFRILATDISLQALQTAVAGRYPVQKVATIPALYRSRFIRSAGAGEFEIAPELKNCITFKRLNFNEVFPFKRKFHVIFCRNVMIYFDEVTIARLVGKFSSVLTEGAYFLTGHSESISRKAPLLRYLRPSVYRKDGKPG